MIHKQTYRWRSYRHLTLIDKPKDGRIKRYYDETSHNQRIKNNKQSNINSINTLGKLQIERKDFRNIILR